MSYLQSEEKVKDLPEINRDVSWPVVQEDSPKPCTSLTGTYNMLKKERFIVRCSLRT